MAKLTSVALQRLRMRIKRLTQGTRLSTYGTCKPTAMGIEFDALRDYVIGDDVRSIDWKSTARAQKIMTRLYREQMNRTVMVLLDTSESLHVGSTDQLKSDLMREIAFVLQLIAEAHQDAFGVITTDQHAPCMPPRHGREHYRRGSDLIATAVGNGEASWHTLSREVMRLSSRQALLFVVTDGIAPDLVEALAPLAQRHTVALFRILDPHERRFPSVGHVAIVDPETGERTEVSSYADAARLRVWVDQWLQQQQRKLGALGVQVCDITVGEAYETKICAFLQQGL